jgi:ketosteroid isomerase-like protein
MADPALTQEVRGFFEQYTEAFDSIDGNRIAALYCMPTVTMRGDGSIHCLQSREELARFFQGVADTYHRDGYRSGSFKNLQVTPIGARSALATLDWELRRMDGSIIRQWRQSYNVVRVAGGWRILVSTFHVE